MYINELWLKIKYCNSFESWLLRLLTNVYERRFLLVPTKAHITVQFLCTNVPHGLWFVTFLVQLTFYNKIKKSCFLLILSLIRDQEKITHRSFLFLIKWYVTKWKNIENNLIGINLAENRISLFYWKRSLFK